MQREKDHLAKMLTAARDYARAHGFTGTFLIEPKPMEPTKHQYDVDVETVMGFLRANGLDKDFKVNIEVNHATLAGHTFEHELRIASINNMLGCIDANEGDPNLGWDVDRFTADVYSATYAMLEVINNGGLTGGFNFDAKNRRPSNTYSDMFEAFILGMDTFALGLLNAEKIIKDGRINKFIKEKYSSFESSLGQKIRNEETSLEELASKASELKGMGTPCSGKQEYLEEIINQILFS
jgi:xylose isomerase